MLESAPVERIETDHLVGIRVDRSHLPFFLDIWQDPQVSTTLGGMKEPRQIEATLDSLVADWDAHGYGAWLLSERDGGTPGDSSGGRIGYGGLRRVTVEGTPEIEILYGFLPGAWGHGYASELARESVRVAFDEVGLADVVSFTLPGNRASRRVMVKAGLAYERDITHAGLRHVLYRRRRGETSGMQR